MSNTKNFNEALNAIKNGSLAFRVGWNNTAVVWLKPSCVIKAEWCKDPILKNFAELNGGEIEAQSVLCMCINDDNNNKTIVSGWNPTAQDVLADDWIIVE